MDALSSLGSNLGSSAKGMFSENVGEKALLYIYLIDLSGKNDTTLLDLSGSRSFIDEINNLNKLQKTLMKKTKGKLSLSSIASSIGDAVSDQIDALKPGANSPDKVGTVDGDFVKFKVQYNPATMRLYSVNGKVQSRRGQDSIDELKVYNYSGKSKLSFDLIFDDCDNMNAFGLNEAANVNMTSLVNKGLSAWSSGGLTHSVRKRMDAIMSLLSSSATQQVVFFWSNMVFRGTITDVGNKFTMFNPEGNPIRGEMHLEITQDRQFKDLKYDETYWENAFKQCFKAKSGLAGLAGGQSLTSKLTNNNLINLSL